MTFSFVYGFFCAKSTLKISISTMLETPFGFPDDDNDDSIISKVKDKAVHSSSRYKAPRRLPSCSPRIRSTTRKKLQPQQDNHRNKSDNTYSNYRLNAEPKQKSLDPPSPPPPPPPPNFPPVTDSLESNNRMPTLMMPRSRQRPKRQYNDPLGASLHSYRRRQPHHTPLESSSPSHLSFKNANNNSRTSRRLRHRGSCSGSGSGSDGLDDIEENQINNNSNHGGSGERRRRRPLPDSLRLRRSLSGGITKHHDSDSDSDSSDDDNHTPPPSPPPTSSFEDYLPSSFKNNNTRKSNGRREFSSKIHDNHFCGQMMMMPLRRARTCYDYPRYNYYCSKNTTYSNKRWRNLFIQISAVIVTVACLYVHSNQKVRQAHQQFQNTHIEKSHILTQMEWLNSRSKKEKIIQSYSRSSGGGGVDSVNNNNDPNSDKDNYNNEKEEYYQRQILGMEEHIQELQHTIQEQSKQDLLRTIPSLESSSSLKMEMKLSSDTSPIIFELFYQDMPYTTWTWIDQISKGLWNDATIELVDHNWIDIHPITETTTTTGEDENEEDSSVATDDANSISVAATTVTNNKLAFREIPIMKTKSNSDSHRSVMNDGKFVLGIRNIVSKSRQQQDEGKKDGHIYHHSLFVLTIHYETGTCEEDESESCFGQLIKGYDQLNDWRRGNTLIDNPLTVTSFDLRKEEEE